MNQYITAETIKRLREERNMTQLELANLLGVSDKTISKWENSRGLPDITLVEDLAKVLGISVIELFTGDNILNQNVSANMMRSKFYVCPICGNVIHTMGEAVISCCGVTLPVLEAEEMDEEHNIQIEEVEDEYYITMNHQMTKGHHISFLAFVTSEKIELVKLYAEQNVQVRFKFRRQGVVYCYCNKHGLMKQKIIKKSSNK